MVDEMMPRMGEWIERSVAERLEAHSQIGSTGEAAHTLQGAVELLTSQVSDLS